jgi:hypothetical protein
MGNKRSSSLTLHSHTHWQVPQANTQAKACQRVCLSHAEKKKLKIPFPSKNFKNAITQSDIKTFGQLVAKLNKEKGCKTRTTRTPATNTGFASGGLISRLGPNSYRDFALIQVLCWLIYLF